MGRLLMFDQVIEGKAEVVKVAKILGPEKLGPEKVGPDWLAFTSSTWMPVNPAPLSTLRWKTWCWLLDLWTLWDTRSTIALIRCKRNAKNTAETRKIKHETSIETQTKKAYFLLSLHFVIWLDDLSISIMILELLVLFWKIDRSSQLYVAEWVSTKKSQHLDYLGNSCLNVEGKRSWKTWIWCCRNCRCTNHLIREWRRTGRWTGCIICSWSWCKSLLNWSGHRTWHNVNFHEDKADFLFQDNRIMVGQRVGK